MPALQLKSSIMSILVMIASRSNSISLYQKKKAAAMQSFDSRKNEIIEVIKNRKKNLFESNSFALNLLGSLVHEKAISTFKNRRCNFCVNDQCIKCRVCEKVCPRNNIVLVNDKLSWKHDCELCYGCYQWCPKGAIDFKESKGNESRGHNSKIV